MSAALGLLAVLLHTTAAGAQGRVPARTIGPAQRDAEASETFSQIRGFRELSDGRLLVTDQIEKKIVLLDLAGHTATRIGREGSGPGEFRTATDLVALRNDTTLVADPLRALDALSVITPDGVLRESFTLPAGTRFSYVFGTDRAGHLFVQPSIVRRPDEAPPDSVPVIRLDLARSAVDTPFYVRPQRREPGAPPNPYSPHDTWVVAPDGRIAIAHVEDYRITWIAPDGKRTTGAPIPFERLSVTATDQEEFRQLARRFGGLGIGQASPRGSAPAPIALGWPKDKPPFFGNDPFKVAPTGELWVRRSQPAGPLPPQHDVIDRTGRLIATVTLPVNTKILALGTHGIYLARYDDDDVIHVERYRYP